MTKVRYDVSTEGSRSVVRMHDAPKNLPVAQPTCFPDLGKVAINASEIAKAGNVAASALTQSRSRSRKKK